MPYLRAHAALWILLVVGHAGPAAAQEPSTQAAVEDEPERAAPARRSTDAVRWRWRSSDIGDYVTIGIGAATAGTMIGIGASGVTTPSRGGILFDDDARGAIRLDDEFARQISRDVSDGFLTLLTSAPFLFDALVLGAWQHDDPQIALELILIHAEVIAVTLALQTTANIIASRERPYGQTCGGPSADDLPEESFFCNSPDRFYSFFSGHTSQSFASAAVVCSAHMNMPLLGGGEVEAVPCVTGFAFAAATGLLRMMGDQHYATDVITGALVGTAVGFLLPWALHFAHERREGEDDYAAHDDVAWALVPTGSGASVIGFW